MVQPKESTSGGSLDTWPEKNILGTLWILSSRKTHQKLLDVQEKGALGTLLILSLSMMYQVLLDAQPEKDVSGALWMHL